MDWLSDFFLAIAQSYFLSLGFYLQVSIFKKADKLSEVALICFLFFRYTEGKELISVTHIGRQANT